MYNAGLYSTCVSYRLDTHTLYGKITQTIWKSKAFLSSLKKHNKSLRLYQHLQRTKAVNEVISLQDLRSLRVSHWHYPTANRSLCNVTVIATGYYYQFICGSNPDWGNCNSLTENQKKKKLRNYVFHHRKPYNGTALSIDTLCELRSQYHLRGITKINVKYLKTS
ncbi:hypothetical protein BDF21DRAFT_402942 [Thamnidium elegans]|nr:hypothetical protein BDF21DRAFT_402942 [Thamnidium elegans]